MAWRLEHEIRTSGNGEDWIIGLREDLELLKVTGQLEEAVVGVGHGDVDAGVDTESRQHIRIR